MTSRRSRDRRESRWPLAVAMVVAALVIALALVANTILNARFDARQARQIAALESRLASRPVSLDAEQSIPADARPYQLQRGWVARVFNATARTGAIRGSRDIGVFVIDETRFRHDAHRFHGIDASGPVAYRLDGLFVAEQAGEHQFSLDFVHRSFLDETPSWRAAPVCNAELTLGGRRVLRDRANFVRDGRPAIRLHGAAELEPGVHQIGAQLFCDFSDGNGEAREVVVTMRVRRPGDARFRVRDDDVLHAARRPATPASDAADASAERVAGGSTRPFLFAARN